MKGKTNPVGEGKKLLSFSVPADLLTKIDTLAARTGISRSKWARNAIQEAYREERIYGEGRVSGPGSSYIINMPTAKAAEEPPEYKTGTGHTPSQ